VFYEIFAFLLLQQLATIFEGNSLAQRQQIELRIELQG